MTPITQSIKTKTLLPCDADVSPSSPPNAWTDVARKKQAGNIPTLEIVILSSKFETISNNTHDILSQLLSTHFDDLKSNFHELKSDFTALKTDIANYDALIKDQQQHLNNQDKNICKFDMILTDHSVDLSDQSKKLEVLSNAMEDVHSIYAMRHIIYEMKIKELQNDVLFLCTSSSTVLSMVVPSQDHNLLLCQSWNFLFFNLRVEI